MRAILGVLGDRGFESGSAVPGPVELEALVERARLMGVDCSLSVTGAVVDRRAEHLAGPRADRSGVVDQRRPSCAGVPGDVDLSWEDDRVCLEVRNRLGTSSNGGGSGLGVAGMAQRTRLLGGRFEAGRTGTFRVSRPAPPAGSAVMTSAVIVDDQAMVRQGLRLILELAGIEVLAEAEDGEQGVAAVGEHQPDVVLMDVRMPRVDGIEATRRIVASDLPTRVLVLTTFDLDEHVYDALRAGAAGFLLKDVTAERLVGRGEETAAGETPMASSVLRRVIDQFVRRLPDPAADRPRADLSEREAEVFALIGAGMSNPEIAEHLFISVATVKSHVRHILAKLDLRDRVQAVVLAHESGLASANPTAAWGGWWAAPVAALAHQASLGFVRPRGCSNCPCSPCGAGRRSPANRCTRRRTRSSPTRCTPCCRGTSFRSTGTAGSRW